MSSSLLDKLPPMRENEGLGSFIDGRNSVDEMGKYNLDILGKVFQSKEGSIQSFHFRWLETRLVFCGPSEGMRALTEYILPGTLVG